MNQSKPKNDLLDICKKRVIELQTKSKCLLSVAEELNDDKNSNKAMIYAERAKECLVEAHKLSQAIKSFETIQSAESAESVESAESAESVEFTRRAQPNSRPKLNLKPNPNTDFSKDDITVDVEHENKQDQFIDSLQNQIISFIMEYDEKINKHHEYLKNDFNKLKSNKASIDQFNIRLNNIEKALGLNHHNGPSKSGPNQSNQQQSTSANQNTQNAKETPQTELQQSANIVSNQQVDPSS